MAEHDSVFRRDVLPGLERPALLSIEVTRPRPGYIMDMARLDGRSYILIQGESGAADAILVVGPTGEPESRFEIGREFASGLAATPEGLWVLSRNSRSFLRLLSRSGQVLRTIRATGNAPGRLYGLVAADNRFFFSRIQDDRSTVFELFPQSGASREISSLPGKIRVLGFADGEVLAVREHDGVYSADWLDFIDPETGAVRTMRFFSATVRGLAVENDQTFALRLLEDSIRIFPFYIDVPEKRVVGEPAARRVSVVYRFRNENSNPYELYTWLPVPANERFQVVRNVQIHPEPTEYANDRFGNRWARFDWQNDPVAQVRIDFEVLSYSVAYTIPEVRLTPDLFRGLESFTRPTYSFDFEHQTVAAEIARLRRENELGQQIVTLHDHVNNRLRVVGGSGPESKASEFLSQGVGRCYAHTLAFAALGRGIGIPGRAIGGLRIDRGQMRQGEVGEHTWNQIYVPGPGWVDVDTQLDDDPEGDHRRSYIGYRNNSRWVTFVGEYDQRDDRTVFTERSWYRTYRWRSTTGPRARVRAEGPEITSSDLRHW
ncbi:MAG: transglutaminase family protein [Spirochaetales bacterium]|nr:transglutaminase family protein [Leptospiraceae bacterium]MCP5481121.1 transglutaminase family protein [Spirochaetales bacterium]